MKMIVRLLRDFIISLFAVLALCCLFEIGLRATRQHYQGSFYNADPELGHIFRPNARGWNVAENQAFVQINSHRMHDRERTLRRDPRVIRIAVVGDSNTEAMQVPMDQNYCSVLERDLNGRLAGQNLRVEVLNFGVGAYGPAQEYFVIERSIWRFNPQIVILAVASEISILRSTRKLYNMGQPPGYGDPFFELREGKLALDDQTLRERASFPPQRKIRDTWATWTNESRVLALVRAALREIGRKVSEAQAFSGRPPVLANSNSQATGLEPYANVLRLDKDVNKPDFEQTDPDLGEALRVTEAIILKAREVVSLHHAQLELFTIDLAFQVDPNRHSRSEFFRKFGLKEPFGADRKIAAFATEVGIPNAVLGPDIASYAERTGKVLHGFAGTDRNAGHWNTAGHEIVGHLMAKKLWEESPLLHRQTEIISSIRQKPTYPGVKSVP